MTTTVWAKQVKTTDFNCDYPTDRESGPGPLTKRWYAQSKNWMKMFLMSSFYVKPEDIIFHKGHFEWTLMAKIKEQWWYFSTGDIRFNVTGSMLVRKAQHPKDWTGGSNCFVAYDNPRFIEVLHNILATGSQSGQESMSNCYWR